MSDKRPLSEQAKSDGKGCGLYVFAAMGLLFAIVGLAMFVYFAIIPAYKKRISVDWPTAECKITQADIVEHHGDDSTTYSVDFGYTFVVDGQEYSGDRYSFANGSGSRSTANRLRAEFPAGSLGKCFYDPENPSDCVLDRTNSDQDWVSLFVPLIFSIIGSVFFVVGLFGARKQKNAGSLRGSASTAGEEATFNPLNTALTSGSGNDYSLNADQLDSEWSQPRKLKPTQTRLGMFIGLAFFGLFWNGILSIFFFVPDGPFQGGGWLAIGFSLFMIPFLLVGIALIAGAGYFFLAMFNPKVEVALSTGAVPLGGEFDVAWEVDGNISRIKRLTIEVEATQHATYQRGTDTRTDTEIFESLPVAEVVDASEIAFGSSRVTIPADSMHTFEAPRNEIKWKVVVRGEIPWAPDINEEFEFRVKPNFDGSVN